MVRAGTPLAHTNRRREFTVGEKTDQIKGKIKEAAGKATEDRDLEREGQMDQAKGKAKEAWEDVKDAVSGK
jgi:uncharacterized protein YjbJ (UPF0337 family)